MHDFVSFYFCNHLYEEEGAGCFVFIVFRMSCNSSVTLPYGAVGGQQFVIVVFPDHTHLLLMGFITRYSLHNFIRAMKL